MVSVELVYLIITSIWCWNMVSSIVSIFRSSNSLGSGKSSLLRIMCGLWQADSGKCNMLWISCYSQACGGCGSGVQPWGLGGAQSSKRRPPTTEVMGSSPVSNLWSHVGRVRQHSPESRGFSPGSPVQFLPQGKLTGWVRYLMWKAP